MKVLKHLGLAVLLCPLIVVASAFGGLERPRLEGWHFAGRDLRNSRNSPEEKVIDRRNVSELKPRWVFTTHGHVSATPSVEDGSLYVPDWGGYLYRINARTGRKIWGRQIS